MSTTVVFTYRLLNDDPKTSNTRPEWPFLKPRGIAKKVFSSLGGGEAFIQQERKQFHEPRALRTTVTGADSPSLASEFVVIGKRFPFAVHRRKRGRVSGFMA